MTFNLATSKVDDFSIKLRTQNYANIKDQNRKLERDNRKLEDQLRELKLAMNREKTAREQSQGGTFWQSGQLGSLSTYAKDVLKKPTKPSSSKQNANLQIKTLKDESIVVPERPKGPGTISFIAQRSGQPGEIVSGIDKRQKCGQCEEKVAQVSCIECGEDYCAGCFAAFHLKGALKKHRSIPVGATKLRTPREAKRPSTAAGDAVRVNSLQLQATDSNGTSNGDQNHHQLRSSHSAKSPHGSGDFTAKNNSGNSRLIDGSYDEEENAASFQEAVKAWRQQTNNQQQQQLSKPVKQMDSKELGTSTDNDDLGRHPLQIKFTSSLTYAEKLMLKRHRRMDLSPMGETSRSCGSVLDDQNELENLDMNSSRSEKYDNRQLLSSRTSRTATSPDWVLGEHSANDFQPHSNVSSNRSSPVDRNESRISIIELTEFDPSDRLLDKSSSYNVTNCGDDELPPSSRSGQKGKQRRSAFTKSANVPEGSKFSPRPPPPGVRKSNELSNDQVARSGTAAKEASKSRDDKAARSSNQLSSRRKTKQEANSSESASRVSSAVEENLPMTVSGVKKDQHLKGDDSKRGNISSSSKSKAISSARSEHAEALTSSRKDIKAAGKTQNKAEVNTNKQSSGDETTGLSQKNRSAAATPRQNRDGRRSVADGKLTSRTSSKLSSYGEGILTKTPSEALHSLADCTTSPQTPLVSDLGSFFTLGLKSTELTDALSARVNTPGARSAAATPRPASSRLRVSNQLYQLGPRSWKPDASLAGNVSNDQADTILREAVGMTDSILTTEVNDVTTTDELSHGDKRSKPENTSAKTQRVTPSGSRGTPVTTSNTTSVRSNSNQGGRQQKTTTGGDVQVPSTNDDSRFGPWSINETGFDASLDDEMSIDRVSAVSFSLATGVQVQQKNNRNVPSLEDLHSDRSQTPNMMVPRRSLASARSSGPVSSRTATPATGRQSRMIVVDGEDLTRFDNVNDELEQSRDDADTLAQLHRELTEHSIDLSSDAPLDQHVNGDSEPKSISEMPEDFDVQSKLRESLLMYDFEEMEAEIMGQMEVEALP